MSDTILQLIKRQMTLKLHLKENLENILSW